MNSRIATHARLFGVGFAAIALAGFGCTGSVCEEYPDSCGPLGGGGQGGATSTTTSSGGAGPGGNGAGGEGGGIPTDCDPLALAAGTVVPATCGVFVDAGSTAASEAGTQAAPYKSLATALAAASPNQPIYVCTSQLDEAALLEADTRLYGGLDCTTWATGDAAARTPWTAPANEVPLAVRGAGVSATVVGFAITARDAVGFDATTRQGRSSVAAWVEEASLRLERADLVAGRGANGGAGESQSGAAPGRQSDAAAFDGNAGRACGETMPAGGPAKIFACPDGNTVGGKGGDGDLATGSSGVAGLPNLGGGQLGTGQPDPLNGWTCASAGNGSGGLEGTPGTQGLGGSSLGTLAFSLTGLLHLNAPGTDGTPGGRGQGGGGGGGRRGDGQNGCPANVTGPSGGSGGAGGCGGLAGQGGGAGGSSIALVSVAAELSSSGVTLTASSGGTGGAGGNGQFGGSGGLGGISNGSPVAACSGGAGGSGGLGGSGGGGRGGASLGLAYVGTAPAVSPDDVTVAAAPAAGGTAGTGATAGAAGLVAVSEAFPAE